MFKNYGDVILFKSCSLFLNKTSIENQKILVKVTSVNVFFTFNKWIICYS